MDKDIKRFGEQNLHIICTDDVGIIYDVPTNSIFRVSSIVAERLLFLQKNSESDLEAIMKQKLGKKQITIPTHKIWWETKSIVKLTLNITSRCNLRCKYCYAGFGIYSGYSLSDMAPTDAIKYIDSLVNIGVSHIGCVQFFGGEPLLAIKTVDAVCKHFFRLYEEAKIDSIPQFKMITNLVLGNSYIYDVILKYNIQLTVSVDGSKDIHDMQRVFQDESGSYDLVEQNAMVLREKIIAIEATYTLNHVKKNISVEQLRRRLANQFSLPESSILIIPVAGVPELEVPRESELLKVKEDILTTEDGNVLVAYYPEKQSDLFCSAGFNSLCIMPNGDMYPCHMYAVDRTCCLGNILDSYDFFKVKEKLNNLPLGSKESNIECKLCWARKICHICPAKLLISNEVVKSPISEYNCDKRKSHYELVIIQSVSH